jgi:hypothetical protein
VVHVSIKVILFLAIGLLLVGILIGNGIQTQAQKRRDRRQAAEQRLINDSWSEIERASSLDRAWWRARFRTWPSSTSGEEACGE